MASDLDVNQDYVRQTLSREDNDWKDVGLPALLGFVVVAFCVGLLWFFPVLEGAVVWKDFENFNVSGVLSTLLFISLAVQSSLEVFVSNFRRFGKVAKAKRAKTLSDEVATLKQAWIDASDDGKRAAIEDKYKELETDLAIADGELEMYRGDTRKIVAAVGIFAGFIISLSGVRVLQPFVASVGADSLQSNIFHACDILLTSALIAGGSSGIDRITSVYESFTTQAAEAASSSGSSSQQAAAGSSGDSG